MPGLFFTNALMLAGLAALAVPVLIHLLLKRKKKKVPFSTIRFFLQHDEQSSRRRKLRNWLLLALRLLIVALLVLAFSRPFARQNQASAAAGRRQHRVVFVLDRSASMLATGSEGQRWTVAKNWIQSELSHLASDDSVALVDCATHATVLSGFAPPASIAQILRDLKPGYGTSSLGDGLREAVRLFTSGGSGILSTIYVVSDFQKSACHGIASTPLPQEVEVKLHPTGDILSPNLAIVRLETESHDGGRPQVAVASFSDEDSPATPLDVFIDDQRIVSQTFDVKAGASTNIELVLPMLKPGWHQLKAALRTRDAFEIDNSRYGSLFVPEPTQVLIAESRGGGHIFEQESFFLATALDPRDSTNSVPGPFNLKQVTPEQITGELSAKRDSPWNVIILPGLKDLPVGIGSALSAFVRAGGGLVLFLGEGISANRYNAELADLLPARLGSPEANPELNSSWRIAFYDTNTLAFSAFRQPSSGDLRIPEFTKRYSFEASEGSTRLAFFEDGIPLLLTRAVGRGKVVLVNSSGDTAWNDWPKHKTFVPFVHGVTKYASDKATQAKLQEDTRFTAGEDFELNLGPQARRAQFTLRAPDGKETHLKADEQGRLSDPVLSIPGTYSLLDKDGHELRRLALNVPVEESDLLAVRPTDVQQQLVRIQDTSKQTLASGLLGSHHDQREFWTALLLGALILLLVEPFVANRTSA